jgi:hypothetical protein
MWEPTVCELYRKIQVFPDEFGIICILTRQILAKAQGASAGGRASGCDSDRAVVSARRNSSAGGLAGAGPMATSVDPFLPDAGVAVPAPRRTLGRLADLPDMRAGLFGKLYEQERDPHARVLPGE